MKKKDLKQTVGTRYRYFQLCIKLFNSSKPIYLRPNMPFSGMIPHKLKVILVCFEFLSQKLLETILFKLQINERGRRISLTDFNGQLEQDPQGAPYWNIYLETSTLTTGKRVKQAMYEALVKIKGKIWVREITITIDTLDILRK